MQNYYHELLREAERYDQLSQSYKYTNPSLFIDYYQKHYEIIRQLNTMYSNGYSGAPVQRQTALIRAFHAVPGASGVDVYIDGHKVFENLTYTEDTDYVEFPSGRHQIAIYPTGQTNQPLINQVMTFASDQYYTLAVIGQQGSEELFAVADHPDVQQGQTKVRFVHFSPDAPAVSIIGPQGYPWFERVPYKGVTNYVALNPGSPAIKINAAGTGNTLLNVNDLELEAGEAYTVYIVGLTQGTPKLEAEDVEDGSDRFSLNYISHSPHSY